MSVMSIPCKNPACRRVNCFARGDAVVCVCGTVNEAPGVMVKDGVEVWAEMPGARQDVGCAHGDVTCDFHHRLAHHPIAFPRCPCGCTGRHTGKHAPPSEVAECSTCGAKQAVHVGSDIGPCTRCKASAYRNWKIVNPSGDVKRGHPFTPFTPFTDTFRENLTRVVEEQRKIREGTDAAGRTNPDAVVVHPSGKITGKTIDFIVVDDPMGPITNPAREYAEFYAKSNDDKGDIQYDLRGEMTDARDEADEVAPLDRELARLLRAQADAFQNAINARQALVAHARRVTEVKK